MVLERDPSATDYRNTDLAHKSRQIKEPAKKRQRMCAGEE
jgi:hypothetical protein